MIAGEGKSSKSIGHVDLDESTTYLLYTQLLAG